MRPAYSSPQLTLWKRSNDLVISWLINLVFSEIRKKFVCKQIAAQIWDDLRARYSQNRVPRLFNIRKKLASLIQGTKYITSYFTQFRGLMDELDNLAPIPRCTRNVTTCTCGIAVKLVQYEQQMKLSQFFMGKNDQFTDSRGQILLMCPLPDLSQAYVMLLQDESIICHHHLSLWL